MGPIDLNVDLILKIISKYNNAHLINEASALIPQARIWYNAVEKLREDQKCCDKVMLDEAVLLEQHFLHEFISWFKNEFFSWFDTPYCPKCKTNDCDTISNLSDSPQSHIDNIEVFECNSCHTRLYFERYNDPYLLLKTRKGRCSEFAQVFTVMCLALNFEARFICDTNDHTWTEVYSHLQERWIHCDPSEGVIDKPLMYELGWGKKPKLILSFSPSMEVQDVTWRYSSNHKKVLNRREINTNEKILTIVASHNKYVLDHCSSLRKRFVFRRMIRELAEFMTEPKPTDIYSPRLSGSLKWRINRGEIPPHLSTGYTFQLQLKQARVKPRYYCMWYSANKDTYLYYYENGVSCFTKGWKSCMQSYINVTRNVESDWRQAYLVREQNSETGSMTWKFDITETSCYITGIFIKTNAFFLETGAVEVIVAGRSNHILFKNGCELNCFSLHPEKTLSINVILSGGMGAVSWQQAQIARQSIDEGSSISFGIVLYLSYEQNKK